ncbi:MAG: chromosome segregation protein SMC [Sphaerochaetaceae bacterium]
MFLKSLEMQGFKSFAEKTHLDFSDGITSLLGPNGCGKSNIVDAIKWVLGEQSTKTLRAGRMEDVIFNGTDKRKPLPFAEVTLVINNENHILPNDATELEIKRRIFRNGEGGEYYINRQQVTLREVRDLFFDTGVGKSAYSILEQGKIDQILLKSPEERRLIFEEAAGISRFKAQSLEAERKLVKTDENIQQVDIILKETKRTYETRKSQAEKAIKSKTLRSEQFNLEVEVQLSSLKAFLKFQDELNEQLIKAQDEYAAQKEKTRINQEEMEGIQQEMKQHGEQRLQIQLNLKGLEETQNSRNDKLDYLTQRFRELCKQKDEYEQRAQAIKEHVERDQQDMEDKRALSADLQEKIDLLCEGIQKNQIAYKNTKDMIAQEESQIAAGELASIKLDEELQELQARLTRLTDVIVVELDSKLKSSGYRTEDKMKARTAFNEKLIALMKSVEERSEFLGKLVQTELPFGELVKSQQSFQQKTLEDLHQLSSLFDQYLVHEPTFLDDLVAPQGIITEKHHLDQQMSDIHRQVGDNRDKVSYLQEEHKRLTASLTSFLQSINDQTLSKTAYEGQQNAATQLIGQLNRSITEQQYQYSDALNAGKNAEERIFDTQDDIRKVEEEYKQVKGQIDDLNAQLEEQIGIIEGQTERIRHMQEEQSASFQLAQDLHTKKETIGVKIVQLQEQIKELYTNFFDNYGKSLKEYENRLEQPIDDYPVLKNRLDDIKKELNALGNINQMAEDEFNEVRTQYEFLTKQIDDLNKAKADLLGVVQEIKVRSEQMFSTTYKQISQNFQEMFRRLFGGGRAELKLVEPENVLESGVDIFAQPPGKKLVSLSLLSGGERSMTAVALLFATYLVKPSPFCILDEIDAALDDRNIGNFLTVLQGFAQTSQFIIITHNKHTVLGSSSMLGVTQMEPGVSTTVSYRLEQKEGKPVVMDDQERKIEFTDEGVAKPI